VAGNILDPLTLTVDDDLDEDMSEIGGLVWSCCTEPDQVSETLYVHPIAFAATAFAVFMGSLLSLRAGPLVHSIIVVRVQT
jgi:hypothetical protein